MVEKIKNKRKIILNPIEQRYIASCYPLKDRAYYEEALKMRNIFRELANKNEKIEIDLSTIALAFPHLSRLYIEGFFNNRTIQSYFEGIDDKSHNMRNYLFAKARMREALKIKEYPWEIMKYVLEHVEYCSVKPCYVEENLIISYCGELKDEIDKNYFSLADDQESCFAFVHGRSEKGSILIRYVTKDEFENLLEWFEKRYESKENPFKMIKKYYSTT